MYEKMKGVIRQYSWGYDNMYVENVKKRDIKLLRYRYNLATPEIQYKMKVLTYKMT